MSYCKSAFVVLILFLSSYSSAFAGNCDERKGLRFVNAEKYRAAFQHLAHCETEPGVSGDALYELAKLYGSMDHTKLSEIEVEQKVWHLMHRAGSLGDERALSALIRLYARGNDDLNIEANPEIRQCLEKVGNLESTELGAGVTGCFTRT